MTHSALIRWVPAAQRRIRPMLPVSLRWVGLGRFDEDGPEWPDGSWSVELRFDTPPAEVCEQTLSARVRFLANDAPHERLRSGVQFEIYDGVDKLADVDVLD
jgi:hypothetical protein